MPLITKAFSKTLQLLETSLRPMYEGFVPGFLASLNLKGVLRIFRVQGLKGWG